MAIIHGVMRIAMFTNAYPPHVGGVSRSVCQLAEGCRQRGHEVLVIAPEYGEKRDGESDDILRLQALQNVSGSDFSLALPMSLDLARRIDEFNPDLLHSHYPFLIGDTALRVAAYRHIPIVFTHHTRYEAYGDYLPIETAGFRPFVISLATGYANLCDQVIAPSRSMQRLLRKRGVSTRISVIPTGVELKKFKGGDACRFREHKGISEDACVVGYVGRLAPEKNLVFWAMAVSKFLTGASHRRAVVVGEGKSRMDMEEVFREKGVVNRVCFTGTLKNQELADAYAAIDVFAFASRRETQGLVLVEALAAGCPLVALDGVGAREIVRDGWNGRLVQEEDEDEFLAALENVEEKLFRNKKSIRQKALRSARAYDVDRCVDRIVKLYGYVLKKNARHFPLIGGFWEKVSKILQREGELWKNRLQALRKALSPGPGGRRRQKD